MIPIILLSFSYFIYDNAVFKGLNAFVITWLFILLYIYTVKPTFKLKQLISDTLYLIFEPLNHIGNLYKTTSLCLKETFKISHINTKKIKSTLLVIPIILVVLILLCSADMEFSNIFTDMFKFLDNISIDNIIGRTIVILLLFTYLGAVIDYLVVSYKDREEIDKSNIKIENYTIKLLLVVLNVIYIVFDFIQIKSLMLHQVAENINYAEYARSGFFQLMFISMINLVIILCSKRAKESDNTKSIKIMSVVMVLLTVVIIISSFFRMYMYESMYGYTLLRLLVYVTLFTEIVLLIPTVIYILNSKVNIFKHYLIITLTVYTLLSLAPIDYVIANNNINRYYRTNKIDLDYLQNYNSDNIPLLVDLYDKTNNKEIKEQIAIYFKELNDQFEIDNFQEFNISKNKAIKEIKDFN